MSEGRRGGGGWYRRAWVVGQRQWFCTTVQALSGVCCAWGNWQLFVSHRHTAHSLQGVSQHDSQQLHKSSDVYLTAVSAPGGRFSSISNSAPLWMHLSTQLRLLYTTQSLLCNTSGRPLARAVSTPASKGTRFEQSRILRQSSTPTCNRATAADPTEAARSIRIDTSITRQSPRLQYPACGISPALQRRHWPCLLTLQREI